jgi:CheY-like chemotaxis protein
MPDPKMKFLVVDDFSTMRRIVRNLLKELGFANVDEAEDGAIALQKLQGGGFEFRRFGLEHAEHGWSALLQTIRATPTLKHLPVIDDHGRSEEGKHHCGGSGRCQRLHCQTFYFSHPFGKVAENFRKDGERRVSVPRTGRRK